MRKLFINKETSFLMEYQIGNIIENSITSSNVENNFVDAYDTLCDIEERINIIEHNIIDVVSNDIESCNAHEVIINLNNISDTITDINDNMKDSISIILSNQSSINDKICISYGMEKYMAVNIVLKKFEILRLRCEKIKKVVEKTALQITKKILICVCSGEGSKDPITTTVTTTLSSLSVACNSILNTLGLILTLIQNTTTLNVDGAGCCFFPTPKSMKRIGITIKSTTNSIPDIIDKTITETEESIKESNGIIKRNRIAECATHAAISTQNGNLDLKSFGNLEPFKPETIKTAVNMILQGVLDADALPRYEKLKISNIRFLTFLITGFEPAAKKSFGIPGFP